MRKFLFIFIVLILLFILVYSANFYFLSRLSGSINNSSKSKPFSDTSFELTDIINESSIKHIYKVKSSKYDPVKIKIIKNFATCSRTLNYSDIWEEVNTVSFLKAVVSLMILNFSLTYIFSGLKGTKFIRSTMHSYAKYFKACEMPQFSLPQMLTKELSSSSTC